jgi:hypothetical protein
VLPAPVASRAPEVVLAGGPDGGPGQCSPPGKCAGHDADPSGDFYQGDQLLVRCVGRERLQIGIEQPLNPWVVELTAAVVGDGPQGRQHRAERVADGCVTPVEDPGPRSSASRWGNTRRAGHPAEQGQLRDQIRSLVRQRGRAALWRAGCQQLCAVSRKVELRRGIPLQELLPRGHWSAAGIAERQVGPAGK